MMDSDLERLETEASLVVASVYGVQGFPGRTTGSWCTGQPGKLSEPKEGADSWLRKTEYWREEMHTEDRNLKTCRSSP